MRVTEMKIKHCLVTGMMIAAIAGGIVGCKSNNNDPYRTSDRVMDDKMIKERVTTALNNSPVYKFPHVSANAYNGVVQLSGFVHREEQRAAATETARNTEGVRDVVNNITVVPQDRAYGGTVDPRIGVRGTGTNYPATTTTIPRSPNQ